MLIPRPPAALERAVLGDGPRFGADSGPVPLGGAERPSMRRGAPAWIGLLMLMAGHTASAQVPLLPPPSEPAQPASARQLEKRFLQGRDLLAEKNFAEGTRFLQSILE